MNIIGLIKSFFSAISSIFGFLKQKDSEYNTPEMIKNKEKQQDQDFKDKVNKDLEDNNVKELGKDISI